MNIFRYGIIYVDFKRLSKSFQSWPKKNMRTFWYEKNVNVMDLQHEIWYLFQNFIHDEINGRWMWDIQRK